MHPSRAFGARCAALLFIAYASTSGCTPEVSFGERCERSSDCAEPFACVLGRCREQCREARDCDVVGALCVPYRGAGVCTLPSDVCTDSMSCPETLSCDRSRGVCRASCEDAECLGGSHCELRGEHALCIEDLHDAGAPREDDAGPHDAGPHDAGLHDAGPHDGGARSCRGPESATFDDDLDGFCFEASSGDPMARVARVLIRPGVSGLRFDMEGAAPGAWVRAYQEVALDEGVAHTFAFSDIAPGGGTVVVALEALDARGAVLGRVAHYFGTSADPDACEATGRDTAECTAVGSVSVTSLLTALQLLAHNQLDLRGVASVRRVIEVIASAGAPTQATLDVVYAEAPWCPLAWYRTDLGLLNERFDRPLTGLDPRMRWVGDVDAPLYVPRFSECAGSPLLRGDRWLEWSGTLPATGAVTLELFFHPGTSRVPPQDEREALIWQRDGDLGVTIEDRHLVASAGACAGGGRALEVVDDDTLGVADAHVNSLEIVLDRDAGRLCLARNRELVGCDTELACPLPARGTAPLVIGHGDPELHRPFLGTIDELRIRSGDSGVDPMRRDGRCYPDSACDDPDLPLRDMGSNGCVAAESCTTTLACPPGHELCPE